MSKDIFMPMAGFDAVFGSESVEDANATHRWGVDDKALLHTVLVRIDQLRAKDEPWLLVALTVGTHHPGIVPSSFKTPGAPGYFERSVAYLDAAIGWFFQELRRRDVFDDTLVIITSDETQLTEAEKRTSKLQAVLAQSSGVLAMWGPGIQPGQIDDRLGMQMDVPLTVLDYLGVEAPPSSVGGRSLLRTYQTPRTAVFGNTYEQAIGAIGGDGEITVCDEALTHCRAYAKTTSPSSPVGTRERPANQSTRDLLETLVNSATRVKGIDSL
jgi:phosphoglycerol transferase MdoB-like AlkP superfamily enzyme